MSFHAGKVQLSLVWNARDEVSFEARQLEPFVKVCDYKLCGMCPAY